jgi:hypothetical protein
MSDQRKYSEWTKEVFRKDLPSCMPRLHRRNNVLPALCPKAFGLPIQHNGRTRLTQENKATENNNSMHNRKVPEYPSPSTRQISISKNSPTHNERQCTLP